MNGPEVRYREFRLRDLEAVMEVQREAFPNPLSGFALLFLSACCRFYVAETDRVAGYLILGNDGPSTLFIHHLAVGEKHRSSGVGAGFLRRYVHPRPCRVTTRASNTGAIRFYETHGFRVLTTIPGREEALVLLGHPGGAP